MHPNPPPSSATPDRGRRILLGLLIWAAVSMALLQWLRVGNSDILALELADSAAGFERALKPWQEPSEALCGLGASIGGREAGYGTLRCQLFFDSLGLVPGYVGLLLLFTLGLSRGAGLVNPVWRHVLCAPAVAAGLFDIAENSMIGRALEDYQRIVLSDATVLDVTHASLGKWGLLALALLCLAGLAWGTARRGLAARPRWLQVAAVVALVASLTVAAGCVTLSHGAFAGGMGLAALAFALIGLWRWRSGPVPA